MRHSLKVLVSNTVVADLAGADILRVFHVSESPDLDIHCIRPGLHVGTYNQMVSRADYKINDMESCKQMYAYRLDIHVPKHIPFIADAGSEHDGTALLEQCKDHSLTAYRNTQEGLTKQHNLSFVVVKPKIVASITKLDEVWNAIQISHLLENMLLCS